MKAVVICVKDDGSVMVGEIPPGETYTNSDESGAEYMQEAGNVREGMELAMSLLQGESPEQEMQAEQDVASGFNEVNPTPAPAGGKGPY